MKNRILYQRVNPAGNITAFIHTSVPKDRWVAVGRALMAQVDPSIEQVAFLSMYDTGSPVRMDMMGGEFCGNATRSFALLKALQKEIRGKSVEVVSVSGAAKPLSVEVDTIQNTASVTLPDPKAIALLSFAEKDYPVVQMEGINHLLLQNVAEDRNLVPILINVLLQRYPAPALGVLFLNEKEPSLVPYVYVTEAQTLYREGSCGSGSFAVAYLYAKKWHLDQDTILLHQPAGIIELSATREGEHVHAAIGGPIDVGNVQEAELDLTC